MARKKQNQPHRSGSIIEIVGASKGSSEKINVDDEVVEVVEVNKIVEIDRSYWTSEKHYDIAEVIVKDSRERVERNSDCYVSEEFSFRFRLRNVEWRNECVRLGHWPVIPAEDIFWEVLENGVVIFSGVFDGSSESVSGLFHLVSQNMMTVRPVENIRVVDDLGVLKLRVEILESAFDACESLLENTRQTWKKSMISVMAWLRPEVTTQETIYGIDRLGIVGNDIQIETEERHVCRRNIKFDAADFYEAIKPSKDAPMLEDDLPDLIPELRPYQRRAAYWMVKREKAVYQSSSETDQNEFLRPCSVPVDFLYTDSRMFYNPFSGSISLHSESVEPHVSGGILADEMGLGKTVELLACIFSHHKSMSNGISISEILTHLESQRKDLKRVKIERIECVCGAVSESPKYKGIWVQCDTCDAWQHADCVGYSPGKKCSSSKEVPKEGVCRNGQSGKSQKHKKKNSSNIVEMEGYYVCQLCSELIQASQTPVDTGATLIVCPSPILHQWHAEIIRHTRPGSLKTYIYEGVRNASLSAASSMDISELVSADVVLTTYDVLREDLSHDSDRNEGDRRLMRFNKRYPVIPTLLTRIFWWRVCLDEAQMVECNTATATEMALRLHAKHRWCITGTPIQRRLDDLYGLLKFLGASPFDLRRWWLEVIRDPYERRDAGALEFAHKFFKQIMWRSMKVHVADELDLPAQEECVCWLTFSQIEAHFYRRQHDTCLGYARELTKSFRENLHKKNSQGDAILTHVEAAKLLHSLLKLRQACCHPQVGSSGVRSLQQTPMTMDEILGVLVSKAKFEGEEALRKAVMALNALAGIAIIQGDPHQAVSLYKEALILAEAHCSDFQLDHLLNLHIHHNLAEIFTDNDGSFDLVQSMEGPLSLNIVERALKLSRFNNFHEGRVKRQKLSKENPSFITSDEGSSEDMEKKFITGLLGLNVDGVKECDAQPLIPLKTRFRMAYENVKQKYLAVQWSKLNQVQQDFKDSYMQVCNATAERKSDAGSWWLDALHQIQKSKESSKQFISKVEDALGHSRVSSRFGSIIGMKFVIQNGLDSLESSRLALVERILEIDKTMEEPKDEDILALRSCRSCHYTRHGPICIRCELDNLIEVYKARLFFCKKDGKDGQNIVATVEETVDLKKKRSAVNYFSGGVSETNNDSSFSPVGSEQNRKQREIRTNVMIKRNPSELEIVLGIIKTFSKTWLGKDGLSAAARHLLLLEVMRKEFSPATLLATAQTQMLEFHYELNQGIRRLRLRETDTDTSIDALCPEDLEASSMQNTSNKFESLADLSRLKGQLGYLKTLVSKQKVNMGAPPMQVDGDSSTSVHTEELNDCVGRTHDEACPVCHESLTSQKMVFQCGHVTCCNCMVALIEQRFSPSKRTTDKWVMCPTCRQHTDFRNIACADDRQNRAINSNMPNIFQSHDKPEASIAVQGSYGTKIEAVTRRILWIKRTDPMAKVLIFSSWNDVLDVLEHALTNNDISHIRMKGGRKSHIAIRQFKGHTNEIHGIDNKRDQTSESKFFQVMLLLLQHGANGLNLLEAKHVILVEPLLNPAAEAQAINRVHRIGQDKKTLVHRFIVKDTVEERIHVLNSSRTTSTISRNSKNKDQQVLTLKDVETLLSSTDSAIAAERGSTPTESLMHLPPTVAAALAAERRLKESLP